MAQTKKSSKKRQSSKRGLPSSSTKKPTVRRKAKKVSLQLGRAKLELTIKPASKKTLRRKSTAGRKLSVAMIALGLAGSLYFGYHVAAAPVLDVPVEVSTVTAKPEPKAQAARVHTTFPASDAVELQIPAIGIDAQVIKVGKKADGSLETPATGDVVGQYDFAPTPGEMGPAIIAGHVDTLEGPAVFWRLRELRPGQKIRIKRADGKTLTFKVQKVKNYEQDNFPTEEVYGNLDYAGLRLITCGGSFDHFKHRYSHNTVVFASFVN